MICFLIRSFIFSVFTLGLVLTLDAQAQEFSYLNRFLFPISDTTKYQAKYYQQSFENQDSLVAGIYTLDHSIYSKKTVCFDEEKEETLSKTFLYDSLGNVKSYREKDFVLAYEFEIGFYPNGIVKSRRVSKSGEEEKVEFFDEKGNPTAPPAALEGVMPTPYGGMVGWNNYLAENLEFPLKALYRRKGGTVYIYFWLDKEGNIVNPEIMNPEQVYPSLAEEALRVVRDYPHQWTPAQKDGENISIAMRTPIRFETPKR
ncbi:energy transducer TonB [Cyclobacterium qasimii]|uniref:energy transducer TonB n=1 Tax=Cyclobacterium qasimii TaxID=1350429 RepID=UPI000688009F|nr:energy transducer TonB [Cyclobacterium qasimii]